MSCVLGAGLVVDRAGGDGAARSRAVDDGRRRCAFVARRSRQRSRTRLRDQVVAALQLDVDAGPGRVHATRAARRTGCRTGPATATERRAPRPRPPSVGHARLHGRAWARRSTARQNWAGTPASSATRSWRDGRQLADDAGQRPVAVAGSPAERPAGRRRARCVRPAKSPAAGAASRRRAAARSACGRCPRRGSGG